MDLSRPLRPLLTALTKRREALKKIAEQQRHAARWEADDRALAAELENEVRQLAAELAPHRHDADVAPLLKPISAADVPSWKREEFTAAVDHWRVGQMRAALQPAAPKRVTIAQAVDQVPQPPEQPRAGAAAAPRAPGWRPAPARPASPAQPAPPAQRPAVDALEQRRRELEQQLATAQRQEREQRAATFADSAIRAGQAFPAERRHLIDLYTASLEDDARRGAAGPESSAATIEAWIGTRPAHSLTRELVVQGEGGVLEPQTDQPSQGQIDASLALTALGQAALANRGRR